MLQKPNTDRSEHEKRPSKLPASSTIDRVIQKRIFGNEAAVTEHGDLSDGGTSCDRDGPRAGVS